MNKNELVQRLHNYMVDNVGYHLERMDHSRYNLLKKVMDASGSLVPYFELQDNAAFEEPKYYQVYGMLFLLDDVVMMPKEIREALLQWEPKRRKTLLDRNTEWVRRTRGFLYYYGCVSIEELSRMVERYMGQPVNRNEYDIVIRALEYYD